MKKKSIHVLKIYWEFYSETKSCETNLEWMSTLLTPHVHK